MRAGQRLLKFTSMIALLGRYIHVHVHHSKRLDHTTYPPPPHTHTHTQFHFGEEPYVICITVKVNPAKKIAETLSKKYHLDSDFFNPKSRTVSAQYVLLTLEERPLSHLVDSIVEVHVQIAFILIPLLM